MSALSCAALGAAIAAAQPGAVLTLAPGQTCERVLISKRNWARPVTLVARDVTFRGLQLQGVEGFTLVGGQVEAEAGITGSFRDGYAMRVRDSRAIGVKGVSFTNAARGLVISNSKQVLVEGNRFFNIRSDGINLVTVTNAIVRDNEFRDFHPERNRCTAPDGTMARAVPRRVCVAQGGAWEDGDHPDAIQMFGRELADIEISRNRIDGDMQSIGVFNGSFKDTVPTRIRIVDNWARSPRSWGISLQGCQDCAVMRNDVGRTPGGTRRVQINVTGSTGSFCGNRNPDAPPGHPTTQRC